MSHDVFSQGSVMSLFVYVHAHMSPMQIKQTFNVKIRIVFTVICVYTNRCTQIKTYSWDNAQVLLVGNKSDLEHERVVSTERGRRLADQLGESNCIQIASYIMCIIEAS